MIFTLADIEGNEHTLHPMNVSGITHQTIANAAAGTSSSHTIVTLSDGSVFEAKLSATIAVQAWKHALSSWLPVRSSAE